MYEMNVEAMLNRGAQKYVSSLEEFSLMIQEALKAGNMEMAERLEKKLYQLVEYHTKIAP